ncbi:MAG: cation transporter [Chloroflexota bacterium]|nr:cation transporter [Chloroflexota bacterium]
MTKKKFQIEGMHCTSCALLIDEELEEVKGVRRSKTSYAKQISEIEYDEEEVSEAKLVELIAQVGYKVKKPSK